MTRFVPLERRAPRPVGAMLLAKAESYRGSLKDLPAGQAAAQLSELISYFGLERPGQLSAPVVGTPGDPIGDVDVTVLAAMEHGIGYLSALAARRSRQQIEHYVEAERLLTPLADAIFEERRASVEERCAAAARAATLAAHSEMKAQRERAESLVYFIGGAEGPVKIGMAKDPTIRLRALQTSHPMKLAILAITEGGHYRERKYHERFAAHRLEGEWFARAKPITAEIARLARRAAAS